MSAMMSNNKPRTAIHSRNMYSRTMMSKAATNDKTSSKYQRDVNVKMARYNSNCRVRSRFGGSKDSGERLSLSRESPRDIRHLQASDGRDLSATMMQTAELNLQRHLVVKAARLHPEAEINAECKQMYNRQLSDLDRIPAVVRYTRTDDGASFNKEGLQHKIDVANRALGREYHKMNDEDKRKYLEKISAQEELNAMKKRLGLDQAEEEDKIDDLKQ